MANYGSPYAPYGGYPTYMPRSDLPQYPQQAPQMALQAPPVQGGIPAQGSMQTGFQCRPVTSREEAMAVQADYFGPGTIMPDLGHGMVYLKRFNPNTGASDFFDFAVVPPAQESAAQSGPDYAEMFQALGAQLERVSGRIDELFDRLDTSHTKTTSQKGAAKEA